ncbi:hypothetical protein K9L16_01825 [Candidatus Pacearchaeota archaeon]|nr:hypothetical protein [Candidatus Pacearchaeota archaeon]
MSLIEDFKKEGIIEALDYRQARNNKCLTQETLIDATRCFNLTRALMNAGQKCAIGPFWSVWSGSKNPREMLVPYKQESQLSAKFYEGIIYLPDGTGPTLRDSILEMEHHQEMDLLLS